MFELIKHIKYTKKFEVMLARQPRGWVRTHALRASQTARANPVSELVITVIKVWKSVTAKNWCAEM